MFSKKKPILQSNQGAEATREIRVIELSSETKEFPQQLDKEVQDTNVSIEPQEKSLSELFEPIDEPKAPENDEDISLTSESVELIDNGGEKTEAVRQEGFFEKFIRIFFGGKNEPDVPAVSTQLENELTQSQGQGDEELHSLHRESEQADLDQKSPDIISSNNEPITQKEGMTDINSNLSQEKKSLKDLYESLIDTEEVKSLDSHSL